MTNAWKLHLDGDWIAWLTFDRPGEKVNAFTVRVMVACITGDLPIAAPAVHQAGFVDLSEGLARVIVAPVFRLRD